jgi:cytochrome c oxidase assembly protein subunit 15
LTAVTRLELTPATYRRVTAVALAALVFIVVTGAAVRLTGSGLGCPDWPTCDGGQVVSPWPPPCSARGAGTPDDGT